MDEPLQIGVTGGIGSGKSLVCRIFQSLGVNVYDADREAKRLMATDAEISRRIKVEFGGHAIRPDGSPNREYLAQTVFAVKNNVEKLNAIVHPVVGRDYERWLKTQVDVVYVIKEAALLFEAGTDKTLDKIIVITAPERLRIQRVLRRDPQRTEQNVRDIISRQLPEDEKMRRADFIIINDESRPVIPQVLALHAKILALANGAD